MAGRASARSAIFAAHRAERTKGLVTPTAQDVFTSLDVHVAGPIEHQHRRRRHAAFRARRIERGALFVVGDAGAGTPRYCPAHRPSCRRPAERIQSAFASSSNRALRKSRTRNVAPAVPRRRPVFNSRDRACKRRPEATTLRHIDWGCNLYNTLGRIPAHNSPEVAAGNDAGGAQRERAALARRC